SCSTLAVQAAGGSVTTIEGISSQGEYHPVQAAFKEHHGLQCGFCTPGMVMTAVDMINRHGGKLDEATVRHELEGNICRCTGYHNIVKAVLAADAEMAAGRQAAESQARPRRADRTDSRFCGRRYPPFEVAVRSFLEEMKMGVEGIGARVTRKEDKRFLTGKGRYTDDMSVPGMKYAYFV